MAAANGSRLVLRWPVAAEPDEDFADTLADYHELIARLGYLVLALHAAAALFHHYVWKDNTLLRMMPSKRTGVYPRL